MTVPRYQVALMDTVIPPQAGLTPSGIGAAGAGGASVPQTFYRPSGNFSEETYYPMAGFAVQLLSGSPSLDRLQFIPFAVSQRVQIDRIAFEVTVGAGVGGVARCGLYNANQTTLKPTTRLADGGEFVTQASTGIKATTVSLTLLPGVIYCSAFVQGVSTATYTAIASTAAVAPILGYFNSAGAFFRRHGWEINPFAYAALPADVSGQTFVTLETGEIPVVPFFRILTVG